MRASRPVDLERVEVRKSALYQGRVKELLHSVTGVPLEVPDECTFEFRTTALCRQVSRYCVKNLQPLMKDASLAQGKTATRDAQFTRGPSKMAVDARVCLEVW